MEEIFETGMKRLSWQGGGAFSRRYDVTTPSRQGCHGAVAWIDMRRDLGGGGGASRAHGIGNKNKKEFKKK